MRTLFPVRLCVFLVVFGWIAVSPAWSDADQTDTKPAAAGDTTAEKTVEAEVPADNAPGKEAEEPIIDFVLKHNIAEDGTRRRAGFVETKHWTVSGFSGTGAVRVEDGTVFLEQGNDLTGIRWIGPLIRMNYEITLDAMRVAGEDFFCGLTFPYGKDPCSLIVGGWGGTVVGISSLDYNDAYNNETARFVEFDKNRWYRIRLRITPTKIEAWIDGKQIVDVTTTDRVIGIRWEVEHSVPLGIASWRTTGAIRDVQFEAFPAEEPADGNSE